MSFEMINPEDCGIYTPLPTHLPLRGVPVGPIIVSVNGEVQQMNTPSDTIPFIPTVLGSTGPISPTTNGDQYVEVQAHLILRAIMLRRAYEQKDKKTIDALFQKFMEVAGQSTLTPFLHTQFTPGIGIHWAIDESSLNFAITTGKRVHSEKIQPEDKDEARMYLIHHPETREPLLLSGIHLSETDTLQPIHLYNIVLGKVLWTSVRKVHLELYGPMHETELDINVVYNSVSDSINNKQKG